MDPITRQVALASAGSGETVDDVFSTTLYTGTGSAQTITNGINLSGEGGLVWIKGRDFHRDNHLQDTERGTSKALRSDSAYIPADNTNQITSFNSNGFSIGSLISVGSNNENFVSWTFRKAPKFFDVVTYTGNGSGQTISHDLDTTPGMIFIKRTDGISNWVAYHHSLGSGSFMSLNTNNVEAPDSHFNYTNPTTTEFTLGSNNDSNGINNTFVAYLFAKDEDFIKCGSWIGSSAPNAVNVGFEPQFLMIKSTASGDWYVLDTQRGVAVDPGTDYTLRWSQTLFEGGANALYFTSTGFTHETNMYDFNNIGTEYIYMAIAAP